MQRGCAVIAILAFVATVSADYGASDDVTVLTTSNFDSQVLKSEGLWLVEFYAPWCGHCKNLEPEWKKAAKALKGVVHIAAVDATAEASLGSKYGVSGYPTIKVFGEDKKKPTDYQGGRTADAIVSAALSEAKNLVNHRLGGKKSGGSSKGGSDSGSKKGGASDVVELTEDNFDQIMESKDIWLVEFFAPWCGHCKSLAPEWEKAATELKGQVKIAAVDATVHASIAGKYGVRGYPTIKVFGVDKSKGPSDYEGPRQADGIVQYALEQLDAAGVGLQVVQMLSNEDFETCVTKKICVIAVLPHIADGGASVRNGFIDVVTEAAKKLRTKAMSWYWVEAGAQSELENTFGLTYGFPALIAVNKDKMKYTSHTGPFTSDKIKSTLGSLRVTGSVKQLPKLATSAAWDGKDWTSDEEL